MYIEYSLRGLLTAFFRQRKKFAAVFAAVFLIGFWHISTVDRVYAARGSLLVRTAPGVIPGFRQGGAGLGPDEADAVRQSNIEILQSRGLVTEAVNQMEAATLYPDLKSLPPEAAAEEAARRLLAGALQVTAGAKSNIVNIAIFNADGETARKFLDILMKGFVAKQSALFSPHETGFAKEQAETARTRMRQSQKELQDFRKEAGISDLDTEMSQLINEKSNLSGYAFQAVTQADATLTALEGKAAEIRSTYKPDSPVVKRLDDSIAAARAQVLARQADFNSAPRDNGVLAPKLAKIDARIAYLDDHRGRYEELAQRAALDEETYKTYMHGSEEARVGSLLNQQNITPVSIVDSPAAGLKPEPRRRVLKLIAFLMTAVLFGLGAVIGFEWLDDRIAGPERIVLALGLPVLTSFMAQPETGRQA